MPNNITPIITPVSESILDAICAVEEICQEDPWTKGNFADALKMGYHTQALIHPDNADIIGYYVAMKGVDEAHLLNISIAPAYQKQGCAKLLLELLRLWATHEQLHWIWLEVRENNQRAISVYEKFGFVSVGKRKNYYLRENGERENAILMSLEL